MRTSVLWRVPVILVLAVGCTATKVPPAPHPVDLYLRVTNDHGHQVRQTSARTLDHQPTGTSIVLLSMNHIGMPSYYASLERELEGADLILLEGWPSDRDLLPQHVHETLQWIGRLYDALARILEVTTQAEWEAKVIDHRWTLLDAPLKVVAEFLEHGFPTLSDDAKREFDAWINADRTCEEIQKVRASMLEGMFTGVGSETSGDPVLDGLNSVREGFIFDGLSDLLQQGKHGRIVMVYGSGHMRALEPRITSELGFRFHSARWYDVLERALPID